MRISEYHQKYKPSFPDQKIYGKLGMNGRGRNKGIKAAWKRERAVALRTKTEG